MKGCYGKYVLRHQHVIDHTQAVTGYVDFGLFYSLPSNYYHLETSVILPNFLY